MRASVLCSRRPQEAPGGLRRPKWPQACLYVKTRVSVSYVCAQHEFESQQGCCIASYIAICINFMKVQPSPTQCHQGALQKKSTRLESRKNLLPCTCNSSGVERFPEGWIQWLLDYLIHIIRVASCFLPSVSDCFVCFIQGHLSAEPCWTVTSVVGR